MAMIGAEVDPTVATAGYVIGFSLWIVFGTAGFFIARSRGANPGVGVLMGLMCGLPGLYFASRLPSSAGPSLRLRPRSDLPDPNGSWDIDPEVAKKLGLPPQAGANVSRPVGPPTASWSPSAPMPPSPSAPPSVSAPPGPMQPGSAPPSWSPQPTPPTSPPVAAPGRWAPDPSGRFPQRWWDGVAWTARVLGADGLESVDPLR